MVRVKKKPKATAEGQKPEDDQANLNDLDTDFKPEEDTEIDRQEESDSEAVTRNCSDPTSTLKKKHHSIVYPRNPEAVAAGTVRITKEGTATNLSDLFNKSLGKRKIEELFDAWTY